jgi:hypothetical protein
MYYVWGFETLLFQWTVQLSRSTLGEADPPRRPASEVATSVDRVSPSESAPSRHVDPSFLRPKATPAPALSNAVVSQPEEHQGLPVWLRLVTALLGPPTLITALALFFGWTRISTQMSYYGIDPTLVGLSTQDYLLRSPDTLFVPLGALLISAFLAVGVHCLIKRMVRGHPNARRSVVAILLSLGIVLLVVGVAAGCGALRVGTAFLLLQLSPGIGVSLITYGAYLRRVAARGAGEVLWPPASLLTAILAAAIVVVSLFWATSEYAGALGTGRARDFAAHFAAQPTTVVHSRDRLDIHADGVLEAQTGGQESAYRFKYTGLRLLLRSGGNLFLLPAGWSSRRGTTIILPDRDWIRLDLTRGLEP